MDGLLRWLLEHEIVVSDTLLGVIVGGIIGFVSSIGVNLIQAYLTRPILSISDETIWVEIPKYGGSKVVRIKVENQGRTAAEDCKASIIPLSSKPESGSYLMKERRVRRVAWLIPKGDFTVTINANDGEYINLCAFTPSKKVALTMERGYPEDMKVQRWHSGGAMETGTVVKFQLNVSASNAKQCVKHIWIRNDQDDKRGVFFYEPF